MPNARQGRTLNMGRRRRLASRALMRALWVRDHGCRFPGCERRRYLHAHHIRHWADGGPTDLDNLVLPAASTIGCSARASTPSDCVVPS